MTKDKCARKLGGVIATLLLAAFCALCVVQLTPTTAFAADGTVTITSKDGTTHEYMAYRLVAGDVADGALMHASFDGCVPADAATAAGAAEADTATAQDLAEWLAGKAATDETGAFTAALSRAVLASASTSEAVTFSSGQATTLPEGYWIFISDDAQPMMLLVDDAAPVKAVEKSTTPVVTKEVQEDATGAWGSAADASGTQAVSYRLTGTLPLNLAAFETYSYWFVDELSAGLKADVASVKATVKHADGATEDIKLDAKLEGQTLKVGSDDLKAAVAGLAPDDVIAVEYTASLDPAACAMGLAAGNPNAVRIEYTRSPSKNATGATPEAKVTLYTYKVVVVKVAQGTSKALAGAKFTLKDDASGQYYQADGTWAKAAAELATGADGRLTFSALDEGSYTLTETAAPKGYDKVAKPVTLAVKSDAATAEAPTLALTVTGPAKAGKADAAAGTLELTVEDPAANGGKANRSTAPKTGDIMRYVGIGVIVVAAVAIVLIIVARKRRVKDEE